MKLLVLLGSVLALAAPAASAPLHVAVGPAALDAELSDTPHCVAPTGNFPCPLGYDDNGTLLRPTDDTVYAYDSADSVRVALAAGPGLDERVNPADLRVNHSAINTMDKVLFAAADAANGLPGPLGNRVTVTPGPNSTLVQVWLIGLNGTQPTRAPYGADIGVPDTDRNGTHGVNGYGAGVDDSDVWVPAAIGLLGLCYLPELGGDAALTCGLVPAGSVQEAWPGLSRASSPASR